MTKDWTAEVLAPATLFCSNTSHLYLLKLVKFPSYVSGPVKAWVLQEEVDRMLGKGALELVEHPGPGYYSHLFLVQKVTGGWWPVIDVVAFSHSITFTPIRMKTVALVL